MKTQNLEMKAEPCPRPWGISTLAEKPRVYICDSNKKVRVGTFGANDVANAELIVRAVNCHDEFINTLESLLEALHNLDTSNNSDIYTERLGAIETRAEKLLKQARGES